MSAKRTSIKSKALKVILVDDDEDDRVMFAEVINKCGIDTELKLLSNGKELMEQLDNKERPLPDLIFLDLNMPVLNGSECLQLIRNKEHFDQINVAIYSTSKSQKHIEQTFIDGANIFITKPHSINKLHEVIKKVLSLNWQYHTSNLDRKNFLLNI